MKKLFFVTLVALALTACSFEMLSPLPKRVLNRGQRVS